MDPVGPNEIGQAEIRCRIIGTAARRMMDSIRQPIGSSALFSTFFSSIAPAWVRRTIGSIGRNETIGPHLLSAAIGLKALGEPNTVADWWGFLAGDPCAYSRPMDLTVVAFLPRDGVVSSAGLGPSPERMEIWR